MLCASDIMRADVFGSSDPFGIVFFTSEGTSSLLFILTHSLTLSLSRWTATFFLFLP